MKMGLIQRPKKEDFVLMLRYMAEEELRRRQKAWDSSQTGKYLIELLHIDIPKYLKKIEELQKEESKEDIQENSSKEKEISMTKDTQEKKNNSNEKIKFEIPQTDFLAGPTISDLDEKQKQTFTEYTSLYKLFALELFEWIKFFFPEEEFKFEDYNTLQKIGIDSSAKFMCLYIQNQLHSHNSDRKAAFTSQRYLSPWNEESAVNYLQRIYAKIIIGEKNRKEKFAMFKAQQIVKKEESSLSYLQIFARTKDMKEASEILDQGLSLYAFHNFQNVLRSESEHNNFVLEKLKMVKDKGLLRHDGSKPAQVRKRFLRKLWKTYNISYTYKEWKELWVK